MLLTKRKRNLAEDELFVAELGKIDKARAYKRRRLAEINEKYSSVLNE